MYPIVLVVALTSVATNALSGCTSHYDCPLHLECNQLQCVDPCEACGVNAECKVENHKPNCFCPEGYTGHPFESCRPYSIDLCHPNPCGHGADCSEGFIDSEGNERLLCTCPRGFIGNPLVSCQKGECTQHDDCRSHQACIAYTCQDPCYTDRGSVCGDNAECIVSNHQPICSCPRGYNGNPLESCSPFTNDANPCIGACGEGALCNVLNGRAQCSCPQNYQGNPQIRCYAECTAHDDCPLHQECYQLQCVDPCEACGEGAECKVENHKPICFCPEGYTGFPFESCYSLFKGDLCRDPDRGNPCGQGAECSHGFCSDGRERLVCTCPHGFIGDPFVSCQRASGNSNQNTVAGSSDPCRPSPCGPNTRCQVTHNGRAQCRCLDDFVPDGNTINGCKPQCTYDGDCPDDYRCQDTKCVRVCQAGACGINADCDSRNHSAICSCPKGYQGQPKSRCTLTFPTATPARVPGLGKECIVVNNCPQHLTCLKNRCIDPCNIPGICGLDAECITRNHQPICYCGYSMVGDPLIPCNFVYPECVRNAHCPPNKICSNNRCVE